MKTSFENQFPTPWLVPPWQVAAADPSLPQAGPKSGKDNDTPGHWRLVLLLWGILCVGPLVPFSAAGGEQLKLRPTKVEMYDTGDTDPIKVTDTSFSVAAYSDDGIGVPSEAVPNPGPTEANMRVIVRGPHKAVGGLCGDHFYVARWFRWDKYYPVAGTNIVELPVPGLGTRGINNLYLPKPPPFVEESVQSHCWAADVENNGAIIKDFAIAYALGTTMRSFCAVNIDGGNAAAQGIDPAYIPVGIYDNYSPSVTNVSLSVDRTGSMAVFEVAFLDTQNTNLPVWSLSVIATNVTLSLDTLQASFNYDPNRLLIVDPNNPNASYATLTSEIASAIIAQFTVASNYVSASSLTIFTNGMYGVSLANTYFMDVIDTGATEAPPPPVASPMIVTRSAGLTVKIALSDIATNWSDVAGLPVELTAVNFTSTNGQPVYPLNLQTNLDGSYVISDTAFLGYVNPANVDDQISYTLSDSLGATNEGYIDIVVSTSPLFGQVTGIINPGGQAVTLKFAGCPGYTYNVQRSTDLSTWTTIWTTTAPPAGPFAYTDAFGDLGGIAPSTAYYRLSWNL